jgi:hypothetical membrane protein
MLIGAVVATPLFVTLWAVQAFTREGFRPTFHPMSLLSLGEGGWVQVLNFVITGMLVAGGGLGLRRALAGGRLVRWASALVMLMGVGLITAGIFPTDAGAGFPAGAPEGAPIMSWHGALHQAGFVLTQVAFLAAAIALSVHFGRGRRRGLMWACIATALAALLVAGLGDPETLAVRLVISATIELALVSVVALVCLFTASAEGEPYAEPHGSTSGTRSSVHRAG